MALLTGWVLLISWAYSTFGHIVGLIASGAFVGLILGFALWALSRKQ